MSLRNVVVTGLGAVTPLGHDLTSSWQHLLAGGCGIVSIADRAAKDTRYRHVKCRVAGLIQCDGESGLASSVQRATTTEDRRRTAPFGLLALAAAHEALQDARWQPQSLLDYERTGVCLGTGIGAFDDLYDTAVSFEGSAAGKSKPKVSPFFVPRILANTGAAAISMKFGLKGPSHAVSTACTTGAHSIGDAFNFIRLGAADVMVAGGAEASIHPLAFTGFERVKGLTTSHNETPGKASQPFNRGRDGFVLGEGAGIVVLEDEEHAFARNAQIYARLTGYGTTSDAYHITQPPESGEGARRSMIQALQQARREPSDIDYVNAHATATPQGDKAEARALSDLLQRARRGKRGDALVSSTKGATGHLLGAAGAVEAIFTILAIYKNIAPPTINLDDVDPDLPTLSHVANEPMETPISVALTNSYGFGGTNATLCFEKYTP